MKARARRTFIAAAMALLAAGAVAPRLDAQAAIGGEWRSDVDRFAHRVIDSGLSPAFGVAVVQGDRVLHVRGFGVADLDTGRPVSGETPFYIASTTKSLTALAAVLAAHRDDLDLDSPMVRYLPDAVLPAGAHRESITVHDLLALTHGLAGGGPVVFRTAFTGQLADARLEELLRYHEPTGRAGTFDYNNLGYNLVGMVLDARFGAGWKDVVRREVLEPVGMDATAAELSAYEPDRIAMPHDLVPEHGFRRIRLAKDDSNLHAAGGHFATPRDMARYLAAHISRGRVEGERVLPPAPIALTHRRHASQDREFGPFHRHGWGYGWDLGTYEGDTLIHRFGAFSGYRSHVSFMPEHDLGVVVLVNGGGPASPAADLLATYIYDRMLGKPDLETTYAERLDGLTARMDAYLDGLADHLAERRARLAPLPRPLAEYAGTYEDAVLGRIEFRVVADGLEMWMGAAHSRAEVYDASDNRLRVVIGAGRVVTFSFDGEGPATAVEIAGRELRRVGT
ncbi:MAG: serine hydrolase [Gemmatimonadota bacterium]